MRAVPRSTPAEPVDIPVYEPVVDHGYIGRRLWAAGICCRPRNRSGSWASPVYFGERAFVDENGFADLQHVLAVARSIGEYMDSYRII